MNLKKILFKVHSTLAVYLAVLITVQLISGVLISFRWELSDLLYASSDQHDSTVIPHSAGSIVENYLINHPEQKITRLYFPRTERSPYLLQVSDGPEKLFVAINAATGAEIAAGGWLAFPLEAALAIHMQPVSGLSGYLIVGLNGLVLLCLAVTGLVYGWPRAGRWQSSLQVKWQAPFRIWSRQLHKAMGFVVAPLALLMAVTGMLLLLEMLLASGPGVTAQAPKAPAVFSANQINTAVALAADEFTAAKLRDIRFGADAKLIVQSLADSGDPWAINRITLDVAPLSIESRLAATEQTAWWPGLLPWHSGSYFGWPGRGLMALCGLCLLAMTVLGIAAWWQNPTRKKTAAAGR